MADEDVNDGAENYTMIADQIAAGILKNLPLDSIRDMLVGYAVQAEHGAKSSIMSLIVPLASMLGKAIRELEEPMLPIVAGFVAPIVAGLFGSEADVSQFTRREGRDDRGGAAGALVDLFMAALAGDATGEIEPTSDGAKRIATAAVHATLEGSLQALIPTLLSDCIPFEAGHFDELMRLPEDVIRSLGVSRLVRRAFSPLVDATAATPMRRFANQKYRPNLLSEADVLRAFTSGEYTGDEAARELAQLGYSERRQAVLLNHALRFLSAADSLTLIRDGQYDRDFARANLRAAGYDELGAENALNVEEIKHLNAIRDDSAAAIKAAYVDRRIDDGALQTYLEPMYASEEDRSLYSVAWRTIRDLNTKRLTVGQVEAAVKANVLPIAAYRDALFFEGYSDDDALTLELLLETQLNADVDVAKLRKQKADEAAARELAAAAAAKAKQDALDAAHALARRGSLSDLRRAAVLGLIPIDRVREILAPQYDADTVAAILGTVDADRSVYLEQQQKAADAAKRAALRHIDVGQLQAAVLDAVITIDQYRQQLDTLGFAPADAAILVATAQNRKADLDAAKAKRAAADAAAKTRSIDLGRLEQLVRAGHRTIADYTAMLGSLGFDEASRAAMVDLLQVRIAEDQAARDARAAVAAANAAQGLSLEQLRRAVILGVKTTDDYQAWLIARHFTIDAQTVLMAELHDAVDQAAAARAKRDAPPAPAAAPRLALATVERAARLGIVSPATYEQRLIDDGYTDDDVAIEMDLLAVELADVQAQRAAAAAAAAKTADRGLSLGELGTAVKLGAASIDAYQARALELGYSAEDVAILVTVLGDELATARAAQARHGAIGGQLAARNLSISDLDQAVIKGLMTIDAYHDRIVALGFGSDDADLLAMLLLLKLPAPPADGTAGA